MLDGTDVLPEFAVNGSALPNVDFDVGESYAGSLPISDNDQDPNKLFFWFFPSENQTVGKEITIWLTGGVSAFLVADASVRAVANQMTARMLFHRRATK